MSLDLNTLQRPPIIQNSRVPTKFCKDSQDLTSASNLNFVLLQTTFPVSHHPLSQPPDFFQSLFLCCACQCSTFSSDLGISSPFTPQLNLLLSQQSHPELPVSSHGTMYLYFREFNQHISFCFHLMNVYVPSQLKNSLHKGKC